jgi:glycosyltransferase involved in cell wall biosynthesis
VAWASPLPPAETGIADYSAELLPHLAPHLDLELFTADPGSTPRDLAAAFPLHADRELAPRASDFDLIVYQVGNNAQFHGAIYRLLLRHPGAVVLHEYLLHHMIQELTLEAGNVAGYREEMRYCYGRTGERVVEAFLDQRLPVDRASFPLFEKVVDASLGVLVHNNTARQRVLSSRPLGRVEVAPMPFDAAAREPADQARGLARQELGLGQEELVLGSFGFVTPHKRLEVALAAFARVRRRFPAARFLIVGSVSPFYDLEALLATELGAGVEVVGRTDLAAFHRYMQAVDVAINLRHPAGGETSATLVRLLGLGLPVAVSDHGPFSEVPDGCCLKVPVDWSEQEVLTAMLELLAEDPQVRRELGENARRFALVEHAPERTAAAYLRFLDELASHPRDPFVPRPPLAPYSRRQLHFELARGVAAALADLGVGEAEGDRPVLMRAAEALVELGLDRGRP